MTERSSKATSPELSVHACTGRGDGLEFSFRLAAASEQHEPPLSSVPPPNVGARAIGKRPRMSRFLRLLITITAICHVPFVVAGAEALRRVGVDSWPSWIVALLSAIAGVALFPGRAKHS